MSRGNYTIPQGSGAGQPVSTGSIPGHGVLMYGDVRMLGSALSGVVLH